MVGTSAAFFGINRFLMPRITGALNRSGVRGFWLPLLLSSTALSMVTSALMTTYQRFKYDQFAPGQGAVQQWAAGLLYSIPSTMLGMGGSQVFRSISHLWRFDIGTEVVQAFTSAGIGSALESNGLQQKRNLATWQRFVQEFVDGVMYFGVGRGVGWAVPRTPRVVARLQQSYGNPAYEVGAVGDLGDLPSPHRAGIPGRPDLPAGVDLANPPWIDPAPWTRGTESQQKWYPKRSDGLQQARANRRSAYKLMESLRRHTKDNLKTRLWKMIDEMTGPIKDQAEKQKVRAELEAALIGSGGDKRPSVVLEREILQVVDRMASKVSDPKLREQLRARLSRKWLSGVSGGRLKNRLWRLIDELTDPIADAGEKRKARGQLADALLGSEFRRAQTIALEDGIWQMIHGVADQVTDPRIRGRLKGRLSESLIRLGLRKGYTTYTDVPYIAEFEVQIRRMRDGKYMDSKENPFFDPVVDGDTLHVWVPGMTESVSIRFGCMNTTEATHEYLGDRVLPPEWRSLRGEFGAYGGWKFLKEMMEAHDFKVYLRVYKVDDYGRPVCEVFVKKKGPLSEGEDPYTNVNLALVEAGWAHAYFVAPDDGTRNMLNEYMGAQERAREAGLGIWQSPTLRERKLFVTSFHGYAHQNDPSWKPSRNDTKSGPEMEYLRVFNTTREYLPMKGYQVRVGDEIATIEQDVWLPPGYGLKIYSHHAPYDHMTHNMQMGNELFVDLALDRKRFSQRRRDWHAWSQQDVLELLDPAGRVICQEAGSPEAFEKLAPEFRTLRGVSF
ncbi:MAG: thermonuclease family protein [Deltaproteobacteria bacterium]|nr:thermonuclease family protein [Deltaproteobacteria bacterium]